MTVMGFGKPTIVSRSKHTVSRKDIDPDALSVLRHLNRNGHKAYLVGGGVRDLLLGHKPKDFDISTDAEPQQIKKLFRNCMLIGRRFRLAHIRFGRDKVIETSTFRRTPENNPAAESEDLVQWDDNVFGSPAEDARRRDFTVNALFYDLSDFSLIDHVGGITDLRKGLIRSIGDPNVRFREDPVRMLRAIRFAARLGFRIESATRKAIIRHHADINLASPSRLLDEIIKLFMFHSSEASFFLLWELKLMSMLLPEVDAYVNANGGREAPIWRHLAALDSEEHTEGAASVTLMLGVLFCDPVMRHVATARQAHDEASDAELIDGFMQGVSERFKIPKAVRYGCVRLFENQCRMDLLAAAPPDNKPRRKAMIRRFVQHDSFTDSLALLEMRTVAGTIDPECLSLWRHIQESEGAEGGTAGEPAVAESTSPVRRRHRRKPRHDPSGS